MNLNVATLSCCSMQRSSRLLWRSLSTATTTTRLTMPPSSTSRTVFLGSLSRSMSCTPRYSSSLQPMTKATVFRRPVALTLPTSRRFQSTDQRQQRQQSKPSNDKNNKNPEEEDALVLTPGQKVVVAGRLTMWAGIAAFATVCAYFIIRELMPTKMSPNRVFDRSFDLVRKDPEVLRRYGDSIKAYGRDHGGHREGRRNFIEHTTYQDDQDGSNRTRVRYNLEGPYGGAFVFAEVSSQMKAGEFVYILVQDKATGRVQTLVDNRAALTAARLSGGNAQAASAMSQLLRGGGGGGSSDK